MLNSSRGKMMRTAFGGGVFQSQTRKLSIRVSVRQKSRSRKEGMSLHRGRNWCRLPLPLHPGRAGYQPAGSYQGRKGENRAVMMKLPLLLLQPRPHTECWLRSVLSAAHTHSTTVTTQHEDTKDKDRSKPPKAQSQNSRITLKPGPRTPNTHA